MERERIPLLSAYIVEVVPNGHDISVSSDEDEIRQVLTLDEVTYYSHHPGWSIFRRFLFISVWIIFITLLVLSWSSAILHFRQYCPYRQVNSSDNFHK
uniref:Solute carrier family 3 member 2 N-terminal domain-containing protein n=1 Tax=Phlebotomus papatasi TaxID=29031 RepID=A0A1B0D2R5_PHLPP